MTAPLSNHLLRQAAADLAADGRSLDALKREAIRDPHGAVKKAARQFEALFMQMVLKSMREATPKSGMFDSPAQDLYAGMLDQQMATKVAAGGTGLTDVIARQLTRQMQSGAVAREPQADRVQARPVLEVARGASVAVAAADDRYAQIARPNPNGALRYAALERVNPAARAAYLDRSYPAPALPGGSSAAPAPPEPRAATADSRPEHLREFVSRHWDHAISAQHATGIPARFILSQAALESGWGRAEIRGADGLPSYNLFGIKATGGWRGRTVEVPTTEYDNGVARRVVERFRAYNNYSEAFRDWAQLLRDNPRYAQVIERGSDAGGFAFGLQRAGYATDPNYGDKLARLIDTIGAVGGPGGSVARGAARGGY
jgi:flagellar protein FlgJ